MGHEQTQATLKAMLEATRDAESDFLLCARHTESEELRQRFVERAVRCRDQATVLHHHLVGHGGKPHVSGSTKGAWHRGWLRIRGALLGQTDNSWLEECNRTEILLLASYKRALLADALSGPLKLMAERQFFGWQHIHSQMRGLRQLARATL